MNRKEISVIVALFVFVIGAFLFSNLTSGDFNSGEKVKEEALDINEIKSKMDEMSVEEIEETISKINKEIERLRLQLN